MRYCRKSRHLGYYADERRAALAVDSWILRLLGSKGAKLNFPEEGLATVALQRLHCEAEEEVAEEEAAEAEAPLAKAKAAAKPSGKAAANLARSRAKRSEADVNNANWTCSGCALSNVAIHALIVNVQYLLLPPLEPSFDALK